MPEGPEVKLFGEQLAVSISGKTLVSVEVLSGRYTKSKMCGLDTMLSRLPTKIIGVGVHGKFLYWINHNDVFVHNTLGMTGSWSNLETKHSRVKFNFENGISVFFNDQRNFGTLKMVPGRSNLIKKLESLGPDMLSQSVSGFLFESRLSDYPDKTLAEVLMNQKIVSGIGNYVKAESLYRSQLSPHRTVGSLDLHDFARLKKAIQTTMSESYRHGGATIQTYRGFDGKVGEYAQNFLVYNQKEDPHDNLVVREKTLDGRTTHWVPAVQK